MAAPGAAIGIAERVGKAVSQDFVVIGGQWFHRQLIGRGKKKREVLVPISYEFHINPVSVGLGAAAIGAAVGLGWLAWNGISWTFGTIVPGLKESDYWQGTIGKLTRGKAGKDTNPALSGGCSDLQDQYRKLNVFNDPLGFLRSQVKAAAKQAGCAWAQ